MFTIGFPELLLVSVVALLVIGPDRLPETIKTMMVWLGKIKRSFANIKTDIEQEIGVDEIRREIHNDAIMKEFDESRQQIQDVIQDTSSTLQDDQRAINQSTEVNKTEPSSNKEPSSDESKQA